jgi:hypothetical protein
MTEPTAIQSVQESVRADHVEISQGGAQNVSAQTVSISQGGAGQVRADQVTVEQGGIGIARARRLSLANGAAFAVVADDARIESGATVLMLLARNASGDVRPLIDARSAVAAGAGIAVAYWLLRRLL